MNSAEIYPKKTSQTPAECAARFPLVFPKRVTLDVKASFLNRLLTVARMFARGARETRPSPVN
ncbi:hypothetical protein EYF80_013779 [Liparis tanakae]|uniref:Uncharacterized protein n=1 Tax=Liparis tanakae TaxID=230148 RepID=A0A4Z2IDI7_9TELE|nr:hypothetical protein EYF80_013779 [Liparis tanakae]